MRMLQAAARRIRPILVETIHQVRRRWRYKLMLRGAVGVLGLGALALVLSAWGLESWRFSPASIVTFRIVHGVSRSPRSSAGSSSARSSGASPTSKLRCISRSTSRRSRPRSSARSKPAGSPRRATRRTRRGSSRAWSSRPSRRSRRSTGAATSSVRRCAATRRRSPSSRIAAVALFCARPEIPAPRPVGAARRLAQRAGRGAVSHRRDARATRACRAASIRRSPRRSPGSRPIRRR